jgi:4a-hydroxytetrahydrobiopterin dehydratase
MVARDRQCIGGFTSKLLSGTIPGIETDFGMSTPLSEKAIQQALETLPGWAFEGAKLQKTFTFDSFTEAMGFVTEMAFSCEKLNHHPELTNVYNRVFISLCTHDAGNRVTEKDLQLALEIEKLAEKRG